MTIKQQIINDIPKFFNTSEFATEVTILDKDGGSLATDVPANFIDGSLFTENTQNKYKMGKFFVPTSYHPQGEFKIGEYIVDEENEDVKWKIMKIAMIEKGVTHLECRTDTRSTFK